MKISSNSMSQVDMIAPRSDNKATQAAPQQQSGSAFNQPAVSGKDARATLKGAEANIGASMIAKSLQSGLGKLENMLGKLLSNMAPSKSSVHGSDESGRPTAPKGSLLERARGVEDSDDSKIHGAGPAAGAGSGPRLINNGGKVLTTPSIDNIYLGTYFTTTQGKSDAAHQDAAAKAWVTSGNEGLLKQYGVGQGKFVGSTVVSKATPKTFTDANGVALVKQLLASGAIKPGDQTIHTINLPPGTVLKDGSATSKDGLGGFHGSYTDPKTGKEVYYAILANNKGSNGIDFTGNRQDNNSIVASHEWSEAATDADVALVNRTGDGSKLGWYDNTNGEIGDIPINISNDPNLKDVWGREGGFAFQKEWSNKDNRTMLTTTTA